MIKQKVFLVLTPIRSTYPKNYKGIIIFCGNKDIDFLQKENPEAEIKKIKTIWTDKIKLNRDIQYISELDKIFFYKVGSALNEFFKFNGDEKYWSIFLRPTVFLLTVSFYERWNKISQIFSSYEVENCIFIQGELEDFVCDDDIKLFEMMNFNDHFNQIILQKILLTFDEKLNYSKINLQKTHYKENKLKKNFFFYFKKIKLKNLFFLYSFLLKEIKNYLLIVAFKKRPFNYISEGINQLDLRKSINYFFKQQNFIFKINNFNKENKINLIYRNRLAQNIKFDTQIAFEKFIKGNIFKILPKYFVENFLLIQKKNSSLSENYKFKNGIILFDQLFSNKFCEKDWLAKNYMNGSNLILAQNGGGWTTADTSTINILMKNFNFNQLVFGNEDSPSKKTYGVGLYRFKKREIFFNPFGKIIYALYTPYGYSSHVRSNAPISDEWLEYMKFHEDLISSFDDNLRNKIILRLKKRRQDYYNFHAKLRKKFSKNCIELHIERPLYQALKDARLLIATLDTTTILEVLASNFPCLLICDFRKFKLSNEISNYYDSLYKSGLLFFDKEEAKKHIEYIFDNVDLWWKSDEVQKARKKFCEKFAYYPDNHNDFFIQKLSKII